MVLLFVLLSVETTVTRQRYGKSEGKGSGGGLRGSQAT